MAERSLQLIIAILAASAVLAAAGTAWIGGWMINVAELRTLWLGSVVIACNTSLGFGLVALALLLVCVPGGALRRRLGEGCALLAGALGILTLAEYATALDLHIDHMLVPAETLAVVDPGDIRPWPVTSLAMVLLATAVHALADHRKSRWPLIDGLALSAAVLAISAMVGYLIEGSQVYIEDVYVTMALPTALMVLLLALAILLAHSHRGLIADLKVLRETASAPTRLWAFALICALTLIGYSTWLAWQSATRERATMAWLMNAYQQGPDAEALPGFEPGVVPEVRARVATEQREAQVVPVLVLVSAATGAAALIAILMLMVRENRARRRAEARVDRFFEGSLDLLAIAGMDGYFKRMNPAFSELLGFTTDELLATPIIDMIHPDDRAATIEQATNLKKGTPMISFENRYRCRDGSWRRLSWRAQPDLTERLLYSTARDVTEIRRIELELRGERALLQSVFESLPGMYVILTPEFNIVTASDEYVKSAMRTREELLGRNLFEAFPENPADPGASGAQNLRASLERVLETLKKDTMAIQRYDVRRPDGIFEERYWSPVNSPLLGADGQLVYLIHRVENVTEFMRHMRGEDPETTGLQRQLPSMEAEVYQNSIRLQEAKRQLEIANRDLEAFSFSVSHDLRAPLRHVQGYVDMLTRELGDSALSTRARRYLQTIGEASVEMSQLIDDLLAFSRMGRTVLRLESLALDELVVETIAALELSMKGRRIQWQIDPLPTVLGDITTLRQVFSNLIGNAIKYTRPRAHAHISIGCAGTEEGRAFLYVRDDGVGFDMQYAHNLFGVFQRLHRAEEFEGTGIGLAIVRQVITRHDGRVWAESVPDQGATVYFTLPLATEDSHAH